MGTPRPLKAPPRGQGGRSTTPKTRASVRHSSRRRADDLRSSREVARAAPDPFVTSSFHKQAVSTPLPDPKTAVDRPAVSSPTEAQEVLRARPRDRRPASDAPRWKRSAGRRGPAPMAPPHRGHPSDHNRVRRHVVMGSETAYGRQFLGERFRPPAVAVGLPSAEARAWRAFASPRHHIARPELRQGPV